jgi:hypothetical protein
MIKQAIRTAATTAALGVLLSGLGGCDVETASGTPTPGGPSRAATPTAPAPGTTPVPGTPAALPDGHVRVTGMVFSARDEEMTPELPFEQGKIIAIPFDLFRAVQKKLNHELVVDNYLQDRLAIPRAIVLEESVDAGDLGLDGTYALTLRPGRYALCLVELGGKRPEDTPLGSFWIERWVEVTVTGDDLQTVLPVYNRLTGEITVLY